MGPYYKEDVIAEFLRVAELVEAWEEAGCGDCYQCGACVALSENSYELNFVSLFFERAGAGEEASAFYQRARELEEMPSDAFELLGERVADLVKRPEVRSSLSYGGFASSEELEFWG